MDFLVKESLVATPITDANGHFGDVALQGVAKRGPADLTRDLELVAGKAHVVKRLEEMRCMWRKE